MEQAPVVHTQMLIRRTVVEVFEAFMDPEVTTRFWYTRSSGRMVPGTVLQWDWEMYGVSAEVRVHEVVPNRRIRITWGEPANEVVWVFEPRADGTTLVLITNSGFAGDHAMAQALDAMGGFAFMLAGLKAWLEHGVVLKLVADQYPDAHVRSLTGG